MLELYVDKGSFVNAIVLRLQTFYTTNIESLIKLYGY